MNQCALRRVDEWVSKKFKIVLQTYGNNIALISLEEIVDYLFREYLNGELWSIVISPNDLNISWDLWGLL